MAVAAAKQRSHDHVMDKAIFCMGGGHNKILLHTMMKEWCSASIELRHQEHMKALHCAGERNEEQRARHRQDVFRLMSHVVLLDDAANLRFTYTRWKRFVADSMKSSEHDLVMEKALLCMGTNDSKSRLQMCMKEWRALTQSALAHRHQRQQRRSEVCSLMTKLLIVTDKTLVQAAFFGWREVTIEETRVSLVCDHLSKIREKQSHLVGSALERCASHYDDLIMHHIMKTWSTATHHIAKLENTCKSLQTRQVASWRHTQQIKQTTAVPESASPDAAAGSPGGGQRRALGSAKYEGQKRGDREPGPNLDKGSKPSSLRSVRDHLRGLGFSSSQIENWAPDPLTEGTELHMLNPRRPPPTRGSPEGLLREPLAGPDKTARLEWADPELSDPLGPLAPIPDEEPTQRSSSALARARQGVQNSSTAVPTRAAAGRGGVQSLSIADSDPNSRGRTPSPPLTSVVVGVDSSTAPRQGARAGVDAGIGANRSTSSQPQVVNDNGWQGRRAPAATRRALG
eukprot:gnl/TRDRNA2_/TRDRNA2_155740_c0_seq1.p1 gnl/TRDRNA2_/TRDRNA2_155740_c0~~gnl/TRDRNA2_/TRDRNA2_155740_c0_seq1.p1  ORF type:complete len:513 (-),score=74.23 gnl/TRDRNA2_/TRDRNA2_155740_c0_seq1:242-1780(-)